jgi:hypothetical protein
MNIRLLLFNRTPFLIISCTSGSDLLWGAPPTHTANFIFIDITDNKKNEEILNDEQIQQIVKSSGWEVGGNIFNGAIFRLFTLSNLGQTKSKDLEIKMGTTGLNGQPSLARKRDVDNFVSKTLNPQIKTFANNLQVGKPESEIYINLCRQVNNLSKLKADKKNLIIYSDMLENSKLFTFLNDEVSMIDFENAEKSCPFPDMSDIEIYIVPPVNVDNKVLLLKSEKQWSNFFASKNAKSFHFDINLNIE